MYPPTKFVPSLDLSSMYFGASRERGEEAELERGRDGGGGGGGGGGVPECFPVHLMAICSHLVEYTSVSIVRSALNVMLE